MTLTDDFCKRHFLVGLLLQEVGNNRYNKYKFKGVFKANAALNDGEAPIRRQVLRVLRNLLAKLEMDDRYESKVNYIHFLEKLNTTFRREKLV